MRFRLRTLLIALAVAPPMLTQAWYCIERYREWRSVQIWENVGEPGPVEIFSTQISCRFDVETLDDDEGIEAENEE